MFLKAGALSLVLLLASRLLGLVRESAQAAAFGASGLADVVVLMLTLPDWLTGVLAAGALSYVLVPQWAGQAPPAIDASQRRVGRALLAAGCVLAVAMILMREPLVAWLAAGVAAPLRPVGGEALAWSAAAIPAALLAALWTTRLQHERDFTGMYAANLVVNVGLIGAIVIAGAYGSVHVLAWLGAGLIVAMLARLAWLRWRLPGPAARGAAADAADEPLPHGTIWVWAVLAAGLPLALPFAARSLASRGGEGDLAVFNYAWKLIELPLILAIQLVATLAFPAISKALADGNAQELKKAVRTSIALAWTLACAAAVALIVFSPSIAGLLFGWGRMDSAALSRVAYWGAAGAWSLLAQSLIAVAVTVLAARKRLPVAAGVYLAALIALLAASRSGAADGYGLMLLLDAIFGAIAVALLVAVGEEVRDWMPWQDMILPFACVVLGSSVHAWMPFDAGRWLGVALAVVFAGLVVALAWWRGGEVRAALAR